MQRGLPEKLKSSRKAVKYKQRDVVEITGISLAMLSKYERGIVTPPSEALAKLAACYHVSIDYLMGLENRSLPLDGLKDHQIKVLETALASFKKSNRNE